MWRLWPYSKRFLGFLGAVLVIGPLGNAVFSILTQNPRPQTLTILLLAWPRVLLLLFGATILIFYSFLNYKYRLQSLEDGRQRQEEQTQRQLYHQQFALIKRAGDLRPEDLGFQPVKVGEQANLQARPFYPAYIPRRAVLSDYPSAEDSTPVYRESDLAQEMRRGNGFILLGQPLSGKTHTLYKIVKGLDGYDVVKPLRGSPIPSDDAFSLLQGRKVILLLDNLNDYASAGAPLLDFCDNLQSVAATWIIVATCREGPELAVVTAEGTLLQQLYAKTPLKLRLLPLTAEEDKSLVQSIGKDYDPYEQFPAVGFITMKEPIKEMQGRFNSIKNQHPEQRDTLQALQLLASAGALPFTHRRLRAVLQHKHVFMRPNIQLRDTLDALTQKAFLHTPFWEDPILPEPAYLLNAVTYREGKRPEDDFAVLAQILAELQDAEGLFSMGTARLLFDGDDQQALDYLDQALCFQPNDPKIWTNKGAALARLERYGEALDACEQAIYFEPDDSIAWSNKASALVKLGRKEEAVAVYKQAIQHGADETHNWYDLAVTLGDLGRYEEALATYEQVLQRDPEDVSAWNNKGLALNEMEHYEEALDAYERALQLKPDHSTALNNKATLLLDLGRFQEAADDYEQLLHLKPDDDAAWSNKSAALLKLKQYQAAIDASDEALRIDPNNRGALNNQGLALVNLGRLAEALGVYEKVLRIDVNTVEAWLNKGTTLAELGQLQNALGAIEQAIALKPDFPDAWYNKGLTLNELMRHEEALKAFEQAITLKPDYADAWNSKGFTLSDLGHCEEALVAYDQALHFKPNHQGAWLNKAVTLADRERNEEALNTLEQLIHNQPDDSVAHYNKGVILMKLKRYNEALVVFEQTLHLNPNDPDTLLNKALALGNLGRIDEGRKYADQGLALLRDSGHLE